MKKGLFEKRNGIKKVLFCACFAMSMMMFSTTVEAQTRAYTSTTDKEENFKYYEGKVTSGVNIRVDAGADKDKVIVDGKGVTLSKGTIVTITGNKKVGSKTWYKVKFTYGEQELEGYATSTYIKKTGVVITPTPMPITPEPTQEPTIAPEPTQEAATVNPTIAPVKDTETDHEASSGNTVKYVVISLAAIAIAGGGIYYYLNKKKDEVGQVLVSEKVAKLKEVAVSSKLDKNSIDKEKEKDKKEEKEKKLEKEKEKGKEKEKEFALVEKKRQEGRISKRDKILRQSEMAANKSEIYVVKSNKNKESKDLGLAATLEAIDIEEFESEKEHNPIQQDNTDKKALRVAINNLRQHDIILHRFFGKGEVYDNSDVRLIEVRFGSDVRFLNKEQLVNKKLIQITNEKAESSY